MDPVVVDIPLDFMRRGPNFGRSKTRKRVFIAYRMQLEDSIRFRTELGQILEDEYELRATDGRIDPSQVWAPAIRKRIADSSLVVADLTGPSREVLFECGFAGTKRVLPVVRGHADRDSLPKWLTALNFAEPYLGSSAGETARAAWEMVKSRSRGGQSRPTPIPEGVVWIRSSGSAIGARLPEVARNLCAEQGVDFQVIDPADIYSWEDVKFCLRSWGVIAEFDGGTADYFGHFVLGDVLARQTAGDGPRKGESVNRFGLAVTTDRLSRDNLLASSLRSACQVQSSVLHLGDNAADVSTIVISALKRLGRFRRGGLLA